MTLLLAKRIWSTLGVVTLLLLTASACATSRNKTGDTDTDTVGHLTLTTPTNARTLRVEGINLTGPEVQLAHNNDNSLRGRAFGWVVFLDLKEHEVGGTVNSSLTRLILSEPKPGVTAVQGHFAGTISDFRISDQEFAGSVGRCAYALKATAKNVYEGTRTCSREFERPVTLTVPVALVNQGRPMMLTAIALLLARS